jgi:hypothetical protein
VARRFSTVMNECAVAEGKPENRAIIDLMLAHVPKDRVESAYNRAIYLERRRAIACEWATLIADGLPSPVPVGRPAPIDGGALSNPPLQSSRRTEYLSDVGNRGPTAGTRSILP